MRILFVTPYVPSLIRVRPYNFLKQLSKYHEVTLVSLACGDPCEDENLRGARNCCESVHALHVGKLRPYMNCARHLLTRTPLQAAYTHLPAANRFIRRLVEQGDFDLVHVEHIRGAHLVESIGSIPAIYDSVDCISRLLTQRLSRGNSSLIGRTVDREELFKMRSYEARVASSFDRVIITSEHDKHSLENLIDRLGERHHSKRHTEVSVVRNGVDSEYFLPMDGHSDRPEIVFSGKMSYLPNVSAVIGFYNDVFPRIRRARPDVRLKIVGSEPDDCIRKLTRDPSVLVTGYVPDIRPHIAPAKVVVCPLTVGVGIQNKVLEAMSMGKTVVSTSVGFQGIPGAVDGRHMVIADHPEHMARAVIDILDHPEHGRVVGKNAAGLVREHYSWEASTKALELVYSSALNESLTAVSSAA